MDTDAAPDPAPGVRDRGARVGVPVALVPLRTGGKSRLQGTLDRDDRDRLVLAMFDDVIAAVRRGGVDDIRVLAGSASAHAAAAARGLLAIADPVPSPSTGTSPAGPRPGDAHGDGDARLRSAVDAALEGLLVAVARLVVAADLPRLHASEVARVLEDPAEVVVVPTQGGGTAMLRLAPGVELRTCYGPDSAAAHVAAATAAGRSVALLELAGGRHDVDSAADLAALREARVGRPLGAATAAFLAGVRG